MKFYVVNSPNVALLLKRQLEELTVTRETASSPFQSDVCSREAKAARFSLFYVKSKRAS